MTRSRLGVVLGIATAVVSVLTMLAGSDLPPPPGFGLVIVVGVVLGVVVALLVPRLLAFRDRVGVGRALALTAALGAVAGVALAGVFLVVGPGEPSISPPGVPEMAVFVAVLAIALALAGVAVGVVAVLADGAASRRVAVAWVAIPVALVLTPVVLVIGARVVG